jgi:hypothetical protein
MADKFIVDAPEVEPVAPEPKHYVYPGDVRSPASEVSK